MSDEYRNGLIAAEQKSQDDYDKTIVSLSGGALGISILFIKDIIGKNEPELVWSVICAWSFWSCSIAAVIVSYFLSRVAFRKAIYQVDNDNFESGIGGCAAKATHVFNVLSGILFIVGIVFLIIFASANIGDKKMSNGDDKIVDKGLIPVSPPPTKPDAIPEGATPPPPPPPPQSKPEQQEGGS